MKPTKDDADKAANPLQFPDTELSARLDEAFSRDVDPIESERRAVAQVSDPVRLRADIAACSDATWKTAG